FTGGRVMPKFTDRRPTARTWRRGPGDATVLETKVHRSSARNAKLAFYVATFVVGMLTATVATDRMHPILALLLGALIGTATGAVAWVLVRIWPVLRLIWWWLPEILIGLGIIFGWTALARHTPKAVQVTVSLLVLVTPAIPAVR